MAPKIDFWSIGRRFGRQKCSPRGVPNKTWKINEKLAEKWWGLRGKIIENTLFFIGFREFTPFRKTSKKRCPNGSQNEPKMEQNRPLGTPRVDLFIIFMDFGWCRKIVVFWCRPGASKNQQKSSLGAPRVRKGASDCSTSVPPQRREGPATASRARPSD